MMLKIIPILTDNYVWILYDKKNFCIIIDPGLSKPILKEIKKHKWFPVAILLTHNHIDHTGGVKNIIKHYPNITVFGPFETRDSNVNKIVNDGDKLFILNKEFFVFFTPGHTLGHVTYYSKPYLFCGDTVFSGGCGRVYNKKYLDMYNSIQKILSFPNETVLCCSHEYTLSNLDFSMSILPEDKDIKNFYKKTKKIIEIKKTSLPSYILLEKKINLFLRTDEYSLREAMRLDRNCNSLEVFIKLRVKKDYFWS
ncbi:MAG: hydroxyacylglutathione hydrolase [Buchnera aphidicola (Brevicoryne brassicae)]|uniref:Hydroxyacylglutathione hydrolase n=1 Tax=Buchnera aphidicola (Brevicoryne brassicae) TaxID=911343 RepID=A0AAJ5TXK3_9GAMM|nr:hydroxyacylglutathione hydrolase [Buchnera aphidicola]QCI19814.1 hydroxyacylglutathione hydrolase [Buchnera aphidicola (Brevicoryne brassicae)]WAI19189.1 MAG: hydroxyacylglutathione hydrolase [Buchnera aphidicola (Brevicoryne brassicae)]